MKKYMLILLFVTAFIFLLASCSKDEDVSVINGRLVGMSDMRSIFTIFVEDNYAGTNLVNGVSYSQANMDFDIREYAVEAYRVQVTADTKFIMKETGEEFSLDLYDDTIPYSENTLVYQLYNGSARKVEVKIDKELVQTVSTDRRDYITYDTLFLPLYTATEITLYPLTYENFVFTHSNPWSPRIIKVVEETEPFDEEFHLQMQKHWEDLDNLVGKRQYVDLIAMELKQWQSFNIQEELDGYPYYYVFTEDGIMLETSSWEEVLLYFDPSYEGEE